MNHLVERAFVLSANPFRDNDLMVNLLCEASGRLSCFAPSARTSRKRFSGGIERHCLLEVQLSVGTRRHILEGSRLLNPFGALRVSLPKMSAADVLLDFLGRTEASNTGEGGAFFPMYSLIMQVLESCRDEDCAAVMCGGILSLAAKMGFLPDSPRCSVCGRTGEDGVSLGYGLDALDFRCREHSGTWAGERTLPPEAEAFMLALLKEHRMALPLEPPALAAIQGYVELVVRQVAGELPAWRFWRSLSGRN